MIYQIGPEKLGKGMKTSDQQKNTDEISENKGSPVLIIRMFPYHKDRGKTQHSRKIHKIACDKASAYAGDHTGDQGKEDRSHRSQRHFRGEAVLHF